MATVQHVTHADGSQSLGVTVDGKYVPFAVLSEARVEQLRSSGYYNPEKRNAKQEKGGGE